MFIWKDSVVINTFFISMNCIEWCVNIFCILFGCFSVWHDLPSQHKTLLCYVFFYFTLELLLIRALLIRDVWCLITSYLLDTCQLVSVLNTILPCSSVDKVQDCLFWFVLIKLSYLLCEIWRSESAGRNDWMNFWLVCSGFLGNIVCGNQDNQNKWL